MTTRWLRISIALVRAWTSLYTWRMPPSVRTRRRAEIESDLWESQRGEHDRAALALQIIGRLVLGMWDDVRWRGEIAGASHGRQRAVALCIAAALVVACLWVGAAVSRVEPPQPPPAPHLRARHHPPPPPPPPPPCNPPGIGRPAFSPCTPYRN